MIKAVLLDLDDTLLNQRDASLAALEVFRRAHCPHLEWTSVLEKWNGSIKTHFQMYVRGEMTFQQQRRCRIRDVFEDPGISDASADDLFATYLSEFERNYRLFPDVEGFLDGMSHLPMGIISNGQTRQQEDKLKRTGIHSRFRAILISEAAGIRKPDPRIFRLAADRMGVHPAECLFIGDSYESDYVGSRDAGMVPVLIDREGMNGRSGLRTIRSFEEVQGLAGSL